MRRRFGAGERPVEALEQLVLEQVELLRPGRGRQATVTTPSRSRTGCAWRRSARRRPGPGALHRRGQRLRARVAAHNAERLAEGLAVAGERAASPPRIRGPVGGASAVASRPGSRSAWPPRQAVSGSVAVISACPPPTRCSTSSCACSASSSLVTSSSSITAAGAVGVDKARRSANSSASRPYAAGPESRSGAGDLRPASSASSSRCGPQPCSRGEVRLAPRRARRRATPGRRPRCAAGSAAPHRRRGRGRRRGSNAGRALAASRRSAISSTPRSASSRSQASSGVAGRPGADPAEERVALREGARVAPSRLACARATAPHRSGRDG